MDELVGWLVGWLAMWPFAYCGAAGCVRVHRHHQIREVGDYVVGLQKLVETSVANVHSYLTK